MTGPYKVRGGIEDVSGASTRSGQVKQAAKDVKDLGTVDASFSRGQLYVLEDEVVFAQSINESTIKNLIDNIFSKGPFNPLRTLGIYKPYEAPLEEADRYDGSWRLPYSEIEAISLLSKSGGYEIFLRSTGDPGYLYRIRNDQGTDPIGFRWLYSPNHDTAVQMAGELYDQASRYGHVEEFDAGAHFVARTKQVEFPKGDSQYADRDPVQQSTTTDTAASGEATTDTPETPDSSGQGGPRAETSSVEADPSGPSSREPSHGSATEPTSDPAGRRETTLEARGDSPGGPVASLLALVSRNAVTKALAVAAVFAVVRVDGTLLAGLPVLPSFVVPVVAGLLFGLSGVAGVVVGTLAAGMVWFGGFNDFTPYAVAANGLLALVPHLLWGRLGPLSSGERPDFRSRPVRQLVEYLPVVGLTGALAAAAITAGYATAGFGVDLGRVIVATTVDTVPAAIVLGPPLLYLLYPGTVRAGERTTERIAENEVGGDGSDDDPPDHPSDVHARSTCPSCGQSLDGGEKYCRGCGYELMDQHCPECEAALNGDEKFCTRCGHDLSG